MAEEAPRKATGPPLPPGTRIGRYELVGELGRGGMGVVYRAHDLELGRDVALKTPHPEQVLDEVSRRRFLRTAKLSATLTHGNIVTIFEVFEHGEVPWMAMEFVDGSSLRQLVAGGDPVPIEQAVRYAVDLARALQVAHQKHVLHRDVKPGNVLIAPDGRAMLMDFGLAGFFAPPEEAAEMTTLSGHLTAPGAVLGTVGYMAPEQLLGKRTDPRSDIFSLGAVFYEMVTAREAFPRSSDGAVVDRILHHEPLAIARLNYEVPDELERIIRKCLLKDPDERYQHADELLADLRHLRHESASQPEVVSNESERDKPSSWPGRVAVAAVALTLAALVMLWLYYGRATPDAAGPPGPAGAATVRASVAVLPFADQTRALDGDLRTGMLADLLTARLADSQQMRPIDSARTDEILAALPATEAPAARLAHVARLTASDWLVTGSLYEEAGTFEASVDILQAGGVEVQASFRASAGLITALVDLIAARIEQGVFPGDPAPATGTTGPVSADADRARLLEYRGKQALREARYLGAISDLEAALDIEPGLVSAYGLLAQALHLSGYTQRALESAAAGRRLAERQDVARRTLLTIQAIEAQVQENTDREVDLLKTLADHHPDDPDVLSRLAAARRRRAEPALALPRIEQAIAVDSSDPRLHLEKGRIALDLGDPDAMNEALGEAERLFNEIPSPAGLAEVAMTRGRHRFEQRGFSEAAGFYRNAVELFEESGQTARAVSARKAEGDTELHRGNLDQARSRYEPALAEARRHGNFVLVIDTLNGLAARLISRGLYDEAERYGRRALEEARRLDNPGMSLQSLCNLSSALGSSGKLGESRGLAQEALALARRRNDRPREAFALSRIGDAEFQMGDLGAAEASYRTVVQLFDTPVGDRTRLSAALASLGGVLYAQNKDAASLDAMQRAVDLEQEMGRKSLAAYYLVALSTIEASLARWDEATASLAQAEDTAMAQDLEDVLPRVTLARGQTLIMQGRWIEAVPFLEKARDAGHAAGTLGLEAVALIDLSKASRQRGRPEEAARLAREALELDLAFPTERVLARVELAHALASAGETETALQEARRALDEAGAFDMPLLLARAAAAVLRAQPAATDAEIIARRGRDALAIYLENITPADRDGVRVRPDVAELADLLGSV